MTGHGFSTDEQATLAAIVAQIIPASTEYGLPGADDPQICEDILKSGAGLHDRLAAGLASLSGTVDASRAAEFRQAFPEAAALLQTLTAECYYRDPRVMRALDIDVRPPFPIGYEQVPNDLSLLEPVRARGQIYRKISLNQSK